MAGSKVLVGEAGVFLLQERQDFPRDEVLKLGCEVSREGDFWEVGLKDGHAIDTVVDLIRARGLNLRHLSEKRTTLEDLFIRTVEAAEPGIDRPVRRRRDY